jgi:hypothetical protein
MVATQTSPPPDQVCTSWGAQQNLSFLLEKSENFEEKSKTTSVGYRWKALEALNWNMQKNSRVVQLVFFLWLPEVSGENQGKNCIFVHKGTSHHPNWTFLGVLESSRCAQHIHTLKK